MKSRTGGDMEIGASLRADFLADYRQLVSQFDDLAQDLYQGVQLELLVSKFLAKHKTYLEEIAYVAPQIAGQLPAPIKLKVKHWKELLFSDEAIEEDLAIINSAVAVGKSQEDLESSCRLLADLYRRACQACYLRITFNKNAHDQEDDRAEAVHWGRRAIRYDPNNFQAFYWYMIAVGWVLMGNALGPREKTQLSAIFSQAARRCTRMDPKDPLAYHLLGRYHYNIAQLTWIERAFANNFLGCKLNSTYEEAELEFRRAHELNLWLPTGLWMARVLLAQKKPMDEVKRWIEFGLSQECAEPSTELEKRELLELRKKLKESSK